MTKDINKKYLENLLKSGIPLEYEVTSSLEECGYLTLGEFRFERKNEHGQITEFSTDIFAVNSDYIENSHLDIQAIFECKYGNESTKWFFYPEPTRGPDYSIQVIDRLCPYQNKMDFDSLWDIVPAFIRNMPKCYKGVSINDTSKDESKIEHAVTQVLYAMPNLVYKIIEGFTKNNETEDGYARLIIPVVVTNMEIRVINEGENVNSIRAASSIDNVTTIQKYLKLRPGSTLQLEKYTREVLANLQSDPQYQMFIQKYLENPRSKNYLNEAIIHDDFVSQTSRAMDTIFVVNSAYLKEFSTQIKAMFKKIKLSKCLELYTEKYELKIKWLVEEN